MVALEVYEMLLIKAETRVKPIASTIEQIQENLNTVWNRVGSSEEEKIRLHTEDLSKLRMVKDERNATSHPLQKASIDKLKEEKMNFETAFTQDKQGTNTDKLFIKMIYKNSNPIDLLSWMIKLKSNNSNQISTFVSSLFA